MKGSRGRTSRRSRTGAVVALAAGTVIALAAVTVDSPGPVAGTPTTSASDQPVASTARAADGGTPPAPAPATSAAVTATVEPTSPVTEPTTTTTTAAPVAEVAPGTCETVVYTPSTASQPHDGELCRPATTQHQVAILLVHGGGGVTGDRQQLNGWRDVYLANGYVTFSVNYRLTDPKTDVSLYPLPEQNVKAATQYLRSHEASLGVSSIVLHGGSAGARLGGILLTTAGDPTFAGPELWAGVSDALDGFIGFYGYYDGLQFEPTAYYGGAPDPTADSVERAYLASGPSLVIHGSADALIPVSRSTAFVNALRAAGWPVQYEIVPGAGHGFDVDGIESLTALGATETGVVLTWLQQEFPPQH